MADKTVDQVERVGYVRLYVKIIRMILQGTMSWRGNFFTYLFATTFKEVVQVALIWVVLDRFKSVGGWTIWEVGFLYALNSFILRNFTVFLGGCFELTRDILSGNFDRFLITPRNPLFLMNSHHTSAFRIFYNVSIFAILVTCGKLAGVVISFRVILMFALFVTTGSVIFFAVFLATSSLSFWIRDSSELTDLVLNSVLEYLKYPIHIYGPFIAFLLTFIIPIGFVNYYPAAIFLQKVDNVLYSPHLGYFAPLVAVLSVCGAYLIWHTGLKRYTSTGT